MKAAAKRMALAASTIACVALMSPSWSEHRGVSLGFESAQGADRPPGAARSARRAYVRDRGHALLAAAVRATSPLNYDDYDCAGDPNAWRGYPPGSYYYGTYPGGYCVNRSIGTALYTRPTLFPRYYGGWGP